MPSFDVVSEIDLQEVKNAVDQVTREIRTRYDFKGSQSSVELMEEKEPFITIIADDNLKLGAIQELLKQRLSKRGISLLSVEFQDHQPAGGDLLKQIVNLKQGLKGEELKRLNKLVKDSKIKVSSQAQGDQLRVTGKKRDDLQSMIALLKSEVKDLELQFVNFRD